MLEPTHSALQLCDIPAGASGFHIFISYRRTGVAVARSVKQELRSIGFNCFMDFEALRCGDFQHNLEAALAGTPVVVVVLTPGALTSDARWPGGGRHQPRALKPFRHRRPVYFHWWFSIPKVQGGVRIHKIQGGVSVTSASTPRRYTKFAPSPGQSAGEDPKDSMQHEIDLARRSAPPRGG